MKNIKTTLSINQIVRVSEILELYRVSFKQYPDNVEFYRGAYAMLIDLDIQPKTASALLTSIQWKLRMESAESKRERQEEYNLTVEYELWLTNQWKGIIF